MFLESISAWLIPLDCHVTSRETSCGPLSLKHWLEQCRMDCIHPTARGNQLLVLFGKHLVEKRVILDLFTPLRGLGLAECTIFIDPPSISRNLTPGVCPLLLMLISGGRLRLLYIKAFACAQLNDHPFLMCYDKDDWVFNLSALLQDHF